MENRRSRIKQYTEDLFDFIFPRQCLVCQRPLLTHEQHLCTHCTQNIPRTQYHRTHNNRMIQLFWGKVEIATATAFFSFTKGGDYRQLIHSIKYHGQKECGKMLGAIYAQELLREKKLPHIDIIIPVPLHPKQQEKRGYNQSEWIASGIAQTTGIEMNTQILTRHKHTQTQTEKSIFSRWKNTQNTFSVNEKEETENKSILLVDDVITTGATLLACAEALKKLPIKEIHIITLASAE